MNGSGANTNIFRKMNGKVMNGVGGGGPDLAVNFTQGESDSDVVGWGEVISSTVTVQYFLHLSNIVGGKYNTFQSLFKFNFYLKLLSGVEWSGVPWHPGVSILRY